jgi:hypothetical protein
MDAPRGARGRPSARFAGKALTLRAVAGGTDSRLEHAAGVWLEFARWSSEPPQQPATSRVPSS